MPYWVNQFLKYGRVPRTILSKSCSGYEVDGVILLGMGFLDIQRIILSHLWVPL
jgi:hypothetical protein